MYNKKYGLCAEQMRKLGFKLALDVYEKYNRKCSVCGTEDRLAIHHIDGKGRNYENQGLKPNDSLDNLQLICLSCHCQLHSNIRWQKKLKEQGGYLLKGREAEYHREYAKTYYKKYRQKNRKKINEYQRNYIKKRKKLEQ